MRARADEAMEAARRASQTARLNAAEAAKAVKLAAQGKAEQTTSLLQLEQLKDELAARAQVMQAEAAGISPMVCMNPILLKPTNHIGSQVIVNGEVLGNMSARDYFAYKRELIPDIKRAFNNIYGNRYTS